MSELQQSLAAHLCDSYSAYYDVTPVNDGTSLQAVCAFHSRDSQYVLVKRAEIWAMENHEYLYLHTVPKLDIPTVDAIMARTIAEGEPLVKPHAQHVSTALTAVILCDEVDKKTLAYLQKIKKRRDYKLSLHGWMEFKIATVDCSTGESFTNRAGRKLVSDMRSVVEMETQKFIKGVEKSK